MTKQMIGLINNIYTEKECNFAIHSLSLPVVVVVVVVVV